VCQPCSCLVIREVQEGGTHCWRISRRAVAWVSSIVSIDCEVEWDLESFAGGCPSKSEPSESRLRFFVGLDFFGEGGVAVSACFCGVVWPT
jgi:hypothetical protein